MADSAERAARQLLAGESPTAGDYTALREQVLVYLRTMGADPFEVEDIADETLARILQVRRAVGEVGNPVGYILRTARNERIDRLRRRREEPVDPVYMADRSGATDDDAVLRLLDRDLDLHLVRTALALASREDDVTCLLVVQTWLNLAAEREAAPSSRDVGNELNLAHTTVQRALARFQDYVGRVRKDVSD
jgi:DNA-directed RNA polymerase specialized sigma24 family protein